MSPRDKAAGLRRQRFHRGKIGQWAEADTSDTQARRDRTVRLFMTAPGVGPITALAVAAAFDDPARFRRSSSAGAYLGLTPRRYESGEVSYNGRSSKRGDQMTRTVARQSG